MRYITILFAVLVCQTGFSQKKSRKSPTAVATVSNDTFTARINYSQPSKNGRLIFGPEDEKALVPFGKVWRTGANEATEIYISRDVTIDGNTLMAGTYSIYTIPNETYWTIAFNQRTGYWGRSLVGSPFKEKKDVLRIQPSAYNSNEMTERFTITMEYVADDIVEVTLLWDKATVSFEMNL